MKEEDIQYFLKEKNIRNQPFFSRFPDIEVLNKTVLDFGCGHGALSIDLVSMGAKKVVGIDLNKNRINFAIENLRVNYSQYIDKVTFKNCEITNMEDNSFDVVISKATFEHVIYLEKTIEEIRDKLKFGGKLYAGIGPLYKSPWGDHNRYRHWLPWGHLIFSRKHLLKKLNKINARNTEMRSDLNELSFAEYKRIFNNTKGLKIIDFRSNVSTQMINKVSKLFTLIPFLEEYFTHNIYCILQRTEYK